MNIDRNARFALQIAGWSGVWLLTPLALAPHWQDPARLALRAVPVALAAGLVVALNVGALLPRLYFGGRRGWYFLAAAALVALGAFALFEVWGGPRPRGPRGPAAGFFRAAPLLISVAGSALVEISVWAGEQTRRALRLEREKAEIELKFLRAQTNPHFLFNALNNIYALTLLRPEAAAESLLALSDMLRYMLYECGAARVPLRRELDYLRNYMALFALKDSRGLNVRAEFDESRPELPVAPLALAPLLENAYKHSGIENRETGWIEARLETDERRLRFVVRNSAPKTAETKDATGGVGLGNLRRQLELVYGARHALEIHQRNGVFSAELSIEYAADRMQPRSASVLD